MKTYWLSDILCYNRIIKGSKKTISEGEQNNDNSRYNKRK